MEMRREGKLILPCAYHAQPVSAQHVYSEYMWTKFFFCIFFIVSIMEHARYVPSGVCTKRMHDYDSTLAIIVEAK